MSPVIILNAPVPETPNNGFISGANNRPVKRNAPVRTSQSESTHNGNTEGSTINRKVFSASAVSGIAEEAHNTNPITKIKEKIHTSIE